MTEHARCAAHLRSGERREPRVRSQTAVENSAFGYEAQDALESAASLNYARGQDPQTL